MPINTSSSGARSGKLGKAVAEGELITRLTMWRLRDEVSTSVWADSESGGKANSLPARAQVTGSIGGKFDLNKEPTTIFRAGDQPKLVLWIDTTAKHYWHFPSCTIKSFDLEIDIENGTVVGWTADFESDGLYYAPGESGAPTESLPAS